MSGVYQEYFGGGDVGRGKARMMRAIRERHLSGPALAELIDALEEQGMLLGRPFAPKPRDCWDEDYLYALSCGHISDNFSREFLEHFAEVAAAVPTARASRRKKAWLKAAAVLAALAALFLTCGFLSQRGNDAALPAPGGAAQNVENYSAEEELPDGIVQAP